MEALNSDNLMHTFIARSVNRANVIIFHLIRILVYVLVQQLNVVDIILDIYFTILIFFR